MLTTASTQLQAQVVLGDLKKMDANMLDPVWDVVPFVISIMIISIVFGALGGLFSKMKFD